MPLFKIMMTIIEDNKNNLKQCNESGMNISFAGLFDSAVKIFVQIKMKSSVK
jgi:hypothetical protein